MRKNKKLLLASVAALGALAIGVGATSTFAWYKVGSSIEVVTSEDKYALTSADSTVSVADVKIKVVLSSHESKAVELTNDDGHTGAIVGGNPVTQAEDPEKTIGQIDITAYFIDSEGRKSGDTGYVAPTDDQLAALKNKYWYGTFTAEGNAVILSSSTDSSSSNVVTTGQYQIDFDGNGAIEGVAIKANQNHFAIRTNNTGGAEYKTENADTAPKGQVPSVTWATPTSHNTSAASGAVVLITTGASSGKEVWKLTAAEVANTAPTGKRIDHGADKLVVAADAGSAVTDSSTFPTL